MLTVHGFILDEVTYCAPCAKANDITEAERETAHEITDACIFDHGEAVCDECGEKIQP